jgi:ABC-2 type transport system permease protein
MRALRFLLRKEFLQIFRDRTIVGMLLIVPIVQLLVLASAATFEVRSARVYVVDQDHSPMSRGVVDRLAASGRFVPTQSSPSTSEGNEAMLEGSTEMILVIPRRFERDIVRERRASVQLIFNAEDGAAAGVMQSYASAILISYGAELGARLSPAAMTIAGASTGPSPVRGRPLIEIRRRGWYNPSMNYHDYMVPGIIVELVTIVGTLLTAMNIVREKEAGTLDQLNVTPIKRWAFIAAKLIPLWAFAMVDIGLGLIVARLVFNVPMVGSVALIFLAGSIYLVGALGIGLWISTAVQTQQQAMFLAFALLMGYLLMSGLFTPIRGMPMWAQWTTYVNPIALFVQVMRSVMLKGAGIADIARQLLSLVAIGAIAMGVAVRQYHKTAG